MKSDSILIEDQKHFKILNEIVLWNPSFKYKIQRQFPNIFNITTNKSGYVSLKSINSNIIIIEKAYTVFQYGPYRAGLTTKFNPKYEIFVNFKHICTITATVYNSSTSYTLYTDDLYNLNILKSLPDDLRLYIIYFL